MLAKKRLITYYFNSFQNLFSFTGSINKNQTEEYSTPIIKRDVTAIVPTLNEDRAIQIVLSNLKNVGFNDILVVDGKSVDTTVKIAEEMGATVIFQKGKGKTGAIKTAIEHVKTPYLAVLDGDATYDPTDIEQLLQVAANYNQVIGSRRDKKYIKRLNRLGNGIINLLFNILYGTRFTDILSGMYILNTDFAKQLKFDTEGFEVEIEIAAQAALSKSVTEIPISYNKRIGKQKLNPLRDGSRIILTILKLAKRDKPISFYSILILNILLLSVIVLAITRLVF